jgi:His/Glu/Gln/Arg/opine family amino acid ABC transporter permease subunit
MTIFDFIFILGGIIKTLQYSTIALVLGCIFALPVAMMLISERKASQMLGKSYVSIVSNVPLLLQLSFWYFVFPEITGFNQSSFIATSLAFSIYTSSSVACIIKDAIDCVDGGQSDAARVLGIKKQDILVDIILPQAIKKIIPKLLDQSITLVKDSAIIGFIGVTDLMRRAQIVAINENNFLIPIVVTGVIYYTFILCIKFLYVSILSNKSS